jgi:hypothetical protein
MEPYVFELKGTYHLGDVEVVFGIIFLCCIVAFICGAIRGARQCYKQLKHDYALTTAALWGKGEQLSQLRAKYEYRGMMLEKLLDEARTTGAVRRAFPLKETEVFNSYTPEEIEVARADARKAFALPELPPGVDTAAQVPNSLCKHCGRPLSGHGTRFNECLTTLNPDGSSQEYATSYEAIGHCCPRCHTRYGAEAFKCLDGGRLIVCQNCGAFPDSSPCQPA